MMNRVPSYVALSIVNHISAMVAYWDCNQRCVFSNDAYREWFGTSPEQREDGMNQRRRRDCSAGVVVSKGTDHGQSQST